MSAEARLQCTILAHLVVVSVEDRLVGVALRKALRVSLSVDVVLSASVDSEVRALCQKIMMSMHSTTYYRWAYLVDEGSTLGVGTGGRGLPERAAEVDGAEPKAESIS